MGITRDQELMKNKDLITVNYSFSEEESSIFKKRTFSTHTNQILYPFLSLLSFGGARQYVKLRKIRRENLNQDDILVFGKQVNFSLLFL